MNMQRKRNSGFSLTEVLMAAGILAMGFMMVLTLFPLGLKLTAKQTEATIGTLAAREAFINASLLMRSEAAKADGVPAAAYKDFDDLFDADDYDPSLFLYPTASNVPDDEKRYNTTVLIGRRNGDYAEAIVFPCRRVGIEARFPVDVDDFNNVSARPVVLSLDTDNTFSYDSVPGSWIKISDGHKAVLDTVGLAAFLAVEADIVVNRQQSADMYGIKINELKAPWTDGNYYVVVDRNFSKTTRQNFNQIWFVPPAVGAGRSAAVGVSRQNIRIR